VENPAKETVDCDICGLSESVRLCVKDGYNIVRCKGCGLVYVNPRLNKEALKKMYDDEISPVPQYKETLPDDEKTFRKRTRLLKKFVKTEKPKVLDVGCSVGMFLREARKNGWEAEGIDVDKSAQEYWKKFGLNARCLDFRDAELPAENFDIVIMNDFLEHTESPVSALKRANACLKKGGLLFISTPDIGSALAKISKSRWLHLKPKEHLYYFSRITIGKALEKSGFNVVWSGPIGRVRNLKTVLFKSRIYGDLFWKIILKLRLDRLLRFISFNLNLGDEIALIAVKKTKDPEHGG
jgi:2-polyprenyl-3-methyl-5-hydroxy-6-metoxy-1,4-benzoquinol methylase